MHAPTVRDALQIISGSIRTSDAGVATMLEEHGPVASFQYVVTDPNIPNADHVVDAAIAVIVNTMRQLCGPTWRPSRIRLTPRSAARQILVRSVLQGSQSSSACRAAGVVFHTSALDRPVRDRDPDYCES